ncbi:hypothetical protein J437_LFUL005415 [Ladona fulva]|uniref:Uncharacterized protein n=1 Tax=Ladona fulva TaxID=123851 RepID=A0A8K0NZX1_LADFU|nr:hypothetical protein J437_LFUL005415 [Ladona fulva]
MYMFRGFRLGVELPVIAILSEAEALCDPLCNCIVFAINEEMDLCILSIAFWHTDSSVPYESYHLPTGSISCIITSLAIGPSCNGSLGVYVGHYIHDHRHHQLHRLRCSPVEEDLR